jgi:hypothetical protein
VTNRKGAPRPRGEVQKLQKKFAKVLEGLSPAERKLLLQQSLEEEKPH